jgi:glycosyltransferase involved in cell wall biosynthesis
MTSFLATDAPQPVPLPGSYVGTAGDGVTVLMPVHNAGPHLSLAIDSILQQTYRTFEFLIIDDGSIDDSPATIERFAALDARIRGVRTAHQGVAATLNLGLELARGTIIVRMDADDVSCPERIERQLAFLAEHPDCPIVGTAVRLIDDTGRPLGQTSHPTKSADIEQDLLGGRSCLAHPTVAFRRDVVRAIGGYRAIFEHAEDFDLWLRLSEHHRLANLADVLVDLRCHATNVSRRRRYEQALVAHIATLAARGRRAGRPDPTAGLTRLCLADLDRFDLSPQERASILLELSDAAVISYEATLETRYLADAKRCLLALGTRPDSARGRRALRRLAKRLWRAGEHRNSVATAVSWMVRTNIALLARWTYRGST